MSDMEFLTPRAVLESVAELSSGHQDAAAEVVVGSGGWLVNRDMDVAARMEAAK